MADLNGVSFMKFHGKNERILKDKLSLFRLYRLRFVTLAIRFLRSLLHQGQRFRSGSLL
jgi:hypothetical protein